jgi:hypothetical protein
MWNAVEYFKNICNTLKLTVENNYAFARITGINYLEDVLSNIKKEKAFVAVDDTDDGMIVRKGGAYFKKRVVTVYVLRSYKIDDQQQRETRLAECRTIMAKMHARVIHDTLQLPEMHYVDKSRLPYKEVPGYFANGLCGLYFFVTIEEPVNLCYDATDYN